MLKLIKTLTNAEKRPNPKNWSFFIMNAKKLAVHAAMTIVTLWAFNKFVPASTRAKLGL